MVFDEDVELQQEGLYEVEMNVTKGVLKVMGGEEEKDKWAGRGQVELLGGGALKVEGTIKEINNLARNLLYIPGKDENGWARFEVGVVDLSANKNKNKNAHAAKVEGGADIFITGVNDAPVIHGDTAGVEYVEGGVRVKGLSVEDVDIGLGGVMLVTIECGVGKNGRIGVSLMGAEVGMVVEEKGRIEFSGRLDQVNKVLGGGIRYSCEVEEDECVWGGGDGGDGDVVVVTVSDGGGSGKGEIGYDAIAISVF